MGPTAFRDGIFSQADPTNPGDLVRAYADGSLGSLGENGPTAFRDGVFSQADPYSRGGLLTAYSDGSLGASHTRARMHQALCVSGCYRRPTRAARKACLRSCRGATSGLGLSPSTTGGLLTVAVLGGVLVWMMAGGSKS